MRASLSAAGPHQLTARRFSATDPALGEYLHGRYRKERPVKLEFDMTGVTVSTPTGGLLEAHPWRTIKRIAARNDTVTFYWRDSGSAVMRETAYHSSHAQEMVPAFREFLRANKLNLQALPSHSENA